ncbi:MAG TPA: type II secretion system F family protein [Candidatus Dormibacteraeota bacterium]|jgi:tight adherence protein B|nr:type II secretion system F family protein [Candidatus Dormibacteraeota bacterium]
MIYVLAGAAFVGVLLFFIGATSPTAPAFEDFNDEYLPPAAQGPQNPREVFTGAMDAFNRLLTSRPRSSRVADNLARADLKLRVSEYALIISAAVAGTFALTYLVNHTFVVALLFAVGAFFVPGFYVKYRQRKRSRALNNQLGDTILLLSNALKAGYSFAQAMSTIAKSAPVPMSEEFNRAVREMNLGITVDDALEHMNARIRSDDFDLMVTAVQIHRVVGGNLAEVLDTIAFTIRERIRIQGEIRTLTAQARASGYIITGLPIALIAILTFLSPSYITPLFRHPLGWGMLVLAAIMMGIGYAIIRKISAIEV